MSEHKALSAFEQAKLQEEVVKLRQDLKYICLSISQVVQDSISYKEISIFEESCKESCKVLSKIEELNLQIDSQIWKTALRLNKILTNYSKEYKISII